MFNITIPDFAFDSLPPEALAHVDAIREAEEQRQALENANWQRRQAENEKISALRAQISAYERAAQNETLDERSERALARLKDKLGKLEAPLKVKPPPIKKMTGAERARAKARDEWRGKCDQFRFGPRMRFRYAPADAEGYTLATVRAERDATLDEIAALAKLPVPFEHAVAKIEQALDEAAKKGAPDFAELMRGGGFELPQKTVFAPDLSYSLVLEAGSSLAAWAMRDVLRKKLVAALRERYGDTEGVSREDRAERREALEARLLELERIEARLLWEAEAEGWPRLHPLAVLELVRIEDAPLQYAPDSGGFAVPGGAPTIGHNPRLANLGKGLTD